MANETSTDSKKKKGKLTMLEQVFMALVVITMYPIIRYAEQESRRDGTRLKELRDKLRFFRIEITETFWGKKVKYIQREKPLTEQELDIMFANEHK